MHIDKLDEGVNKYNNKYHRTIQTKAVHVKPSMHVDFIKENNKEGPKFKVCYQVRISKYKIFFAKGTLQIGLKNFLWLRKLKHCAVDIYYK